MHLTPKKALLPNSTIFDSTHATDAGSQAGCYGSADLGSAQHVQDPQPGLVTA